MIYLTYDQQGLQDGLGAQIQRVLSIYWICKQHSFGYIHTPIVTNREGTTTKDLAQFNQSMMLPSDQCSPIRVKKMSSFNLGLIKHYEHQRDDLLIKITFAHQYIDSHPEILSQPFPYRFNWIEETLCTPTNIAVHIRRGDVTPTQNNQRFVDFKYYLDCFIHLETILTQSNISYVLHIYSQGELRSELGTFGRDLTKIKNISLHLDEDINDTFRAFVNADVLLTGFSSLSYAAAMLRRKGCVLCTPFWHQYSNNAICLKKPEDILSNHSKIISALKIDKKLI